MLKNGAVATSQDQSGDTSLHIAMSCLSYSQAMICLLALQTNLNLANMVEVTPFHLLGPTTYVA